MWSLIAPIADKVLGIVEKRTGDKDLAAKIEGDLKRAEQAGEFQIILGQLEVNKAQAKHSSIFVAGARPFIMWVCGIGLGYNVIAYPILDIWFEMPEIQTELLYTTLSGLLGLGTMRSFEKSRGVARRSMSE